MDITFKCPACEQELEADSSLSGTQIECPSCGESIVIPEPTPEQKAEALNPIATSAAAKEEKHFSVPTRSGPAEALIKKANKPLEVAAKETDRRMRIKTIRHCDCIELGKDHFDETVSETIQKIGEKYVMAIHPISYTHLDPVTQKLMDDYGVIIVFQG